MQKDTRTVTKRLAAAVLITAFLICTVSCGKKKDTAVSQTASSGAGYREFLGDYAYDLPAACMVWEPVEGETDESGNPVYGLQYREIKDLDKLLAANDTKFLLYFHSSANSDNAEITALVEEIAERLAGKLAVISLDATEYNELVGRYEISMLPEFVLCGSGMKAKVFGAGDKGSGNMQQVVDWLASNGFSLNGG